MDLRFVNRPKERVQGESSVAKVVSYLQSLYESVAETLPDVRDDGVSMRLDGGAMPVDDNYGSGLTSTDAIPAGKFRMFGKKPRMRRWKMGIKLHQDSHPDVSGKEIRYLPPGVMRDHWEAMKAAEGCCGISFKTFWATWHQEFAHLRFRPTTSHAACATCLHHKLVIRELSNHIAARQKQTDLLAEHLMAQYRDRVSYWAVRGESRLGCSGGSGGTLCCILNGMDQAKFSWPRSSLLNAKDLGTLQRPRLHVAGMLLHGHGIFFSVSHADHPKDSSLSAEFLAIALTRMERLGLDLSRYHLHVQSDNTTREVKNSTFLRLLAALTSHKIVASATLANLRSGHSHEDVDQSFGSLALFLVRHAKQAETLSDFQRIVQQWADGAQRPHERRRVVLQIDQHRDWPLELFSG